jgi:hypothetical protein
MLFCLNLFDHLFPIKKAHIAPFLKHNLFLVVAAEQWAHATAAAKLFLQTAK